MRSRKKINDRISVLNAMIAASSLQTDLTDYRSDWTRNKRPDILPDDFVRGFSFMRTMFRVLLRMSSRWSFFWPSLFGAGSDET